jgi:tetratricopeptide (TPR) repeat protein
METHIDSANLILDEISHPEQLSGEQQARYCRMKAICLINLFMQWSVADSLNNISLDYYRQVNDTIRLRNALFLSGRISMNVGASDKAISRFMELNNMTFRDEQYRDVAYCNYLISQCYLNKNAYENALSFSKKSLYYTDEQDTINTPYYYKHVGMIYAQMNEVDSALVYYKKAEEIALKRTNSERFVSFLFNDISNLLLSNNEFEKALEYTDLSINYRTNRKDISLFNLTKARIFLAENKTDSARFYLERTIQSSENKYITIMAYRHLSDLYKITGNYDLALYKMLNHKEFFEKEENRINSDLLAQQYREEQLKNENNELKLAKKGRELYLLTAALLITIVAIIFWIFFSEEKKKKRIREQQQKEQTLKDQAKIAEHENRLLKQENELSQLREKASVLRESLFRKMSVSGKIPSLVDVSGNHSNESPHKRISLEEPEWTELIQTTNTLFNGFASRLRKEYPALSTEDIGFCCLLKINVSMQDLADIYCISKAGITKRKTRMKKEKFKISDNFLDLDDFLLNY